MNKKIEKKTIIILLFVMIATATLFFALHKKPDRIKALINKLPQQKSPPAIIAPAVGSRKIPIVATPTEPAIIKRGGEEYKKDSFGRVVPVNPKITQPDKNKIIQSIEAQKDTMPRVDKEWVIMRKVKKNGKEEIVTEKKKFSGNETFDQQFEEMKKILAEKDVLVVEPNYILPSIEKPIEGFQNIKIEKK